MGTIRTRGIQRLSIKHSTASGTRTIPPASAIGVVRKLCHGQGTFARAIQARDHSHPITKNVYVQVAKVVLASTPHLNGVSGPKLHGRPVTNGVNGVPVIAATGVHHSPLTTRFGPYRLPRQATSRVDLPGRTLV
jgi:hypothetical protein